MSILNENLDIKKSDSKLDGSAEQMETAEKIKMPTNINPKHLILDAIALGKLYEQSFHQFVMFPIIMFFDQMMQSKPKN